MNLLCIIYFFVAFLVAIFSCLYVGVTISNEYTTAPGPRGGVSMILGLIWPISICLFYLSVKSTRSNALEDEFFRRES